MFKLKLKYQNSRYLKIEPRGCDVSGSETAHLHTRGADDFRVSHSIHIRNPAGFAGIIAAVTGCTSSSSCSLRVHTNNHVSSV